MSMIRWGVITVSCLAALLSLSGCGGRDNAQAARERGDRAEVIKVTCTTGMIADTVKRVGGSRVEVIGLMGPGVDPHLYKATAGDIARLTRADIVFYNGLLLEGKMTDVLISLASKKPVVAVAAKIDESRLLEPPAFAGHYDPHIWFDVSLWATAVEVIRDALIDLDEAHADTYRSNAEAYAKELEELHAYCLSRAEELSKDRRVLVTSHDAYNYFGRAYGFEVLGVQGISTEEQATSKGIVDLSNLIRERKVKAIFTESSVSPKAIRSVIENCRAAGWEVKEGGELFSDALDEPSKPAGTYVGMVGHNIDTIVEALK